MPQCAVIGCNSTHRRTKGRSIKYHRFPGDSGIRNYWLNACGKNLNNYLTARICSRHFSKSNYERDVQHEILGLPTRSRLKKGAIPDLNLPRDFLLEEKQELNSEFAVLYAVGLVPANKADDSGAVPEENKMQIMEEVKEGSETNLPSSPGHADQGQSEFQVVEVKAENTMENGNSEEAAEKENSITMEEVVIKEENSDKECEEELENRIEDNSSNQSSSSESSNKRLYDNGETSVKRLRTDIEENYNTRDKIMNELIEMESCDTTEQIQTFSEQILSEIKTLNELIKEKEREWNHLLHMKKLKEELLIRLQRKKQTVMFNETDQNDLQLEINGNYIMVFHKNQIFIVFFLGQSQIKSNQKANMLRELRVANLEKLKQRHLALQGSIAQKPMLDVQSIIAEYRQRHPENVPRRGRRIRQSQLDSKSLMTNQRSALETPLESRLSSNLNGSLDDSQSSFQGSGNCGGPELRHYKDMLVHVEKLTQTEKSELQRQLQNAVKPPPPYPEVTVHPVTSTSSVAPTNSLLHGILTKAPKRQSSQANGQSSVAANDDKIAFSPTLARLLTAPEKSSSNLLTSTPSLMLGTSLSNQSTQMSVPEMFPGSKARNEITITPLGNEYGVGKKIDSVDDELEDQPDRLVIDETNDSIRPKDETISEDGEEVPQCQGCNQKSAQFVCAGCGNQWYCSRECQVTAWDDHSEVCSG
ncbi:uncharacterized protein LOC126740735 isoform X2 [Anthonomus grandis grandis]|uniref:uncharacterized protein LOC126740735 isoform X2 n=1 Tax=Anthonomus grandis grandis TaxID=2921223 RepID=UPI00216606C3|nr:uncharacterized protein LOC126740735 isoform X2 [Anthonomus grandis grandis]